MSDRALRYRATLLTSPQQRRAMITARTIAEGTLMRGLLAVGLGVAIGVAIAVVLAAREPVPADAVTPRAEGA
jgi:hypothetical protein